jgi:hypothetical protein
MAARTAPGCDPRTRPGRSAVAKRDLLVSVRLPGGRDEVCRALWAETSRYLGAQPGFVSLRLHRAVTQDARYRFVNVGAVGFSAQYRAPHLSEEPVSAARDRFEDAAVAPLRLGVFRGLGLRCWSPAAVWPHPAPPEPLTPRPAGMMQVRRQGPLGSVACCQT